LKPIASIVPAPLVIELPTCICGAMLVTDEEEPTARCTLPAALCRRAPFIFCYVFLICVLRAIREEQSGRLPLLWPSLEGLEVTSIAIFFPAHARSFGRGSLSFIYFLKMRNTYRSGGFLPQESSDLFFCA
jgi:hypothetical protein